jgi:plasmid stability protein
MPTVTIENVSDRLYEKLKKRAGENRRSINNEAIFCLKHALQDSRVDPEAILAKVEALQQQTSLPPLTDEILRAAKEEGRLGVLCDHVHGSVIGGARL